MKKYPKFTTVLAAAGILSFALPSFADDSAVIEQLKQQIQALDQKVRALERKQELDQDARAEAAKAAPTVSIGASGASIQSADSNFVMQAHGVLQVDNRTFFSSEKIPGNDSFVLRRVRPILSGTLFQNADYLFVPDFAGSTPTIFDAYLNYRFRPEVQLRAGKFKVPVGLEQLQQDVYTSFNERSLVTDLVPNRDVGFQIGGDIDGGVASYAVGAFNGVGDARNSANSDFENNREFAGRVFFQPFKNSTKLSALQGLGFGVGGSWGTTVSNATGLPSSTGGASTSAGFATDGQQQFFSYTNGVVANGDHLRISPQAYYYYGPFSLLGEYAISEQRVTKPVGAGSVSSTLQNTAWEVSAGWVLTGENASFTGVTPRRPFSLGDGGWGAFQLVARYADLDIDNKTFPTFADPRVSATEARAWGVGLNWYLNKNLKLATSYSHTDFSGGGAIAGLTTAPGAVTRQPEDVWFTRVQLSF